MLMKKKVLLFTSLLLVVAIAIVAIFMWNKPPETVDDKKAQRITAEALTSAFLQNEQSANASYLNKVLEVSGKIAEVSKNQDGKYVLFLESSDLLSGVQCTMREPGGRYDIGAQINVKGFCNGYTMAVLLSDCIIAEN